jgi:hypothetical protein
MQGEKVLAYQECIPWRGEIKYLYGATCPIAEAGSGIKKSIIFQD